jgi:hypothetical protein
VGKWPNVISLLWSRVAQGVAHNTITGKSGYREALKSLTRKHHAFVNGLGLNSKLLWLNITKTNTKDNNPDMPNDRLQATANSVRSCVAPAVCRA